MSAKEAFAILPIRLNSPIALLLQSRPPTYRIRACEIATQISIANGGELLPPESDLVEIRQLDPGMRKTGPYRVQREASIIASCG